jgi:hypothetical protein
MLFEGAPDKVLDEWTDIFLALAASGAMISMLRNSSDWLTREDGCYSHAKFTPDMVRDLRNALSTNIKLGESPFAIVDYLYKRYVNASIFTVSAVAMSRMNRTWSTKPATKGDCPSLREMFSWNVICSLLRFIRKRRPIVKIRNKADVTEQEEDKKARLLAGHNAYLDTLQLKQQTIVSYHAAHKVINSSEVGPILLELRYKTPQTAFLKHMMNVITIGYNHTEFHKSWTNKDVPLQGTVGELTTRVENALDALAINPQALDELQTLPQRVNHLPETIRYMGDQSAAVIALHKEYATDNIEYVAYILDMNKRFGLRLTHSWRKIYLLTWPTPLSDEDLEKPRGQVYTEKGVEYVSAGFLWCMNPNTKTEDYCHYFYSKNGGIPAPTDLIDPRVLTSFQRNVEYEALPQPRGIGFDNDYESHWTRVGQTFLDTRDQITYYICNVCLRYTDKQLVYRYCVKGTNVAGATDDPCEYTPCTEVGSASWAAWVSE